jgi:hypothetical protein
MLDFSLGPVMRWTAARCVTAVAVLEAGRHVHPFPNPYLFLQLCWELRFPYLYWENTLYTMPVQTVLLCRKHDENIAQINDKLEYILR